jgi:hypothetical protein
MLEIGGWIVRHDREPQITLALSRPALQACPGERRPLPEPQTDLAKFLLDGEARWGCNPG